MNPIRDDDIDALLRQAFEGSVPNDGFSDRVMRQLPPRRRPVAWPLLAGVLAGVVLCALSLLASPLWRTVWQGLFVGAWSSSTIVTLAVMGAMAFLARTADDELDYRAAQHCGDAFRQDRPHSHRAYGLRRCRRVDHVAAVS